MIELNISTELQAALVDPDIPPAVADALLAKETPQNDEHWLRRFYADYAQLGNPDRMPQVLAWLQQSAAYASLMVVKHTIYARRPEMLAALLKTDTPLSWPASEGAYTVWHLMANYGTPDMLALLAAHLPYQDTPGRENQTPLHRAVLDSDYDLTLEIVEALLALGANPLCEADGYVGRPWECVMGIQDKALARDVRRILLPAMLRRDPHSLSLADVLGHRDASLVYHWLALAGPQPEAATVLEAMQFLESMPAEQWQDALVRMGHVPSDHGETITHPTPTFPEQMW